MERSARRVNVVLVEDNPTDVLLVKEALAQHAVDANLVCYRDGEQMLHHIERIESGHAPCPDVILLDLNLPRHDGKGVLERVRNSPVCGSVPVVVVTSSAAAQDQSDAIRLGATRYVLKSIDYDEAMALGAVVRELTE